MADESKSPGGLQPQKALTDKDMDQLGIHQQTIDGTSDGSGKSPIPSGTKKRRKR